MPGHHSLLFFSMEIENNKYITSWEVILLKNILDTSLALF